MEIINVTMENQKPFKALVIGIVKEGETNYTVAVGRHGGIWHKGDWITDKWHFLSEKAFQERFPKLAQDTLNTPANCAFIKQEMDKFSLLSF